MCKWPVAFLGLLLVQLPASAQPFNVRAWYAEGQVWIVWQMTAPPAAPTDTVDIFASVAAQPNTAMMTQVGRLFFPEYTGGRLNALLAGARLLVPTPGGGTYRLAVDEGCFAFTPHQNGALFFAVVDTGNTVVVAANSAATAFAYNPVADPVRPHWQFGGFTIGGNPYDAYVVWADGQEDYNNSRPDIPVLGNRRKNGVPHVFTISLPLNALPAQPLSCVFALHGGEGEYQLFRPGMPARANLQLQLTDGIVVTPDDSVYVDIQGALERTGTSWFGYVSNLDPFDSLPRTVPPSGSVVVDYTSRRVHWILDQLLGPTSPYIIDPERVAMVGHSAGGRGTSHLTRSRADRFCAAVCYTPATDLTIPPAPGQVNFLLGNMSDNLDTNLSVPPMGPVGIADVFTMTTRLDGGQRDFPLTRTYTGKRDEQGSAAWSPTQRAILDSLNDSRMGFMISWDEREHGVEMWDTE